MLRFGRYTVHLATVGISLFGFWNLAEAVELNFAEPYPTGAAVTVAAEDYAKAIAEKSGGDITVKVFPQSLLSATESGAGLRGGLADIAYVVTAYEPAVYPRTNLIEDLTGAISGELANVTDKTTFAYVGAISELILANCDDCLAEYAAQNQVFMGLTGTASYKMLCKGDVSTLEELKGVRVRTGTEGHKRFAAAMGANPTQMALNEVYEGLSQGVVDCNMHNASTLDNLRLSEVVNSVTLGVPGSAVVSPAAGNINRDKWRSLNDDQRSNLIWGGAYLLAHMTWNFYNSEVQALDKAEGLKIKVISPDAALQDAIKDYRSKEFGLIYDLYAANYGIDKPAAEKIASNLQAGIEKWIGLTKDVSGPDDLEVLYREHIFSKIDAKTYGM